MLLKFQHAQHPGLSDDEFLSNSLNNIKNLTQNEQLEIDVIEKNIILNNNFTQKYEASFECSNKLSANWEIELLEPRDLIRIAEINSTVIF